MRYFTAIPFFFPVAASQIDWVKEYEFLDKELQQVLRDEDLGRRYADKLVNVWIENGQKTFVLVHVEVQEQVDIGFSERMFVYNYRFYDRFRKPIVSLAVLADESLDWRPDRFGYALWGSETGIRFPVVKIIDYFKLYDFEIYYQKSLAIVRFLSVALVWLSVLKYIDIDFQKNNFAALSFGNGRKRPIPSLLPCEMNF